MVRHPTVDHLDLQVVGILVVGIPTTVQRTKGSGVELLTTVQRTKGNEAACGVEFRTTIQRYSQVSSILLVRFIILCAQL